MFSFNDLRNKQLDNLTIDLTDKSLNIANKILTVKDLSTPFIVLKKEEINKLSYFAEELNALYIKTKEDNVKLFPFFLEELLTVFLA